MKRTLAPTLLGAVLLATSTGHAFSVSRTDSDHLVRWYNNSNRVDILVDPDGPSRLVAPYTAQDVSNALASAVNSWNTVSCNAMRINIAGTTTTTRNAVSDTNSDGSPAIDGQNIAVWIETRTEFPFGANVLGVTSPVFYQDGTIIEADVVFNGVDDNWAVYPNLAAVPGGSTNGQAVDVESVAVHEFGHLLGLGHVLNGASLPDPPTMTPTVDPHLGTRTLAQNDADGVCFLYPSDANTTHNCATNDNCPQFISSGSGDRGGAESIVASSDCSSNQCSIIEDVQCGGGAEGDRCCTSNCKDNMTCVELGTTTSMAYCAKSCDTGSPNCDDGFTCVPFSTGNSGACISEVVTGCSCDTSDACQSNCACDNDCGAANGTASTASGGCAATSAELFALLGVIGVAVLRRLKRS